VVLATAVRLCEELAVFDPALLTGDDCVRVVEVLSRTEKAVAAARARAAFRAAECGAHGGRGVSDAPFWLAQQAGISNQQARAELDTALAVESCTATKEALVAGDLSLVQAKEIARAEREVPGSQRELLDAAKTESLAVLREKARKIRLDAVDRDELYAKQRAARAHRWWRDELGMVRYSGAMTPEVGIPAMTRLDTETDRIFRASNRDGIREPREAYAADAFAAMLGGAPVKGNATTADVIVVIDLNAYRRGTTLEGEVCHIVGGGPIPVEIARRMAENAFLKAVIHDGVNIHTVKHFGRYIPVELRTALDMGPPPEFDGLVCVKCGSRFRVEINHINPVGNRDNPGETSYINTEGDCPRCHDEVTEQQRQAGLIGDYTKGIKKKGKDPP
jgi:hypothetical protein